METILSMVKLDLLIPLSETAYDDRLLQYIASAQAELKRRGIVLTESVDDQNLVAVYAAWMWRNRHKGDGEPRMIQWMVHNRLMSQKGAVE